MEWHEAIDAITPHIFRITTPQGSGTGFLVSASSSTPLIAVATAAHVINHAHYWEQPIRIQHYSSGEAVLLRPSDRAVRLEEDTDTAAIIMERGDLPVPTAPLPLFEKEYFLKPGVEIGWLGFPAISRTPLCFLSGTVSAWLGEEHAYLVDGVAINGVSGGPAFRCLGDTPELMGVVSAYIPNRATGEALPGLAVVRDVESFHDIASRFKQLDEAKKQEETPPTDPPPPNPER